MGRLSGGPGAAPRGELLVVVHVALQGVHVHRYQSSLAMPAAALMQRGVRVGAVIGVGAEPAAPPLGHHAIAEQALDVLVGHRSLHSVLIGGPRRAAAWVFFL